MVVEVYLEQEGISTRLLYLTIDNVTRASCDGVFVVACPISTLTVADCSGDGLGRSFIFGSDWTSFQPGQTLSGCRLR